MSWGTELWDQYDNISSHTQKGIEFCEKYGQFIKDRCAIESEYAMKMKKLVKNYLPKNEKGDKRKDDEFSSHRGFYAMVKEVNDLAGQHDAIFESFSNGILKDLQSAILEAKQERKRLLTDASKQQIILQGQLGQLDKAKSKYEKAFREAEKSQEAFKRADSDPHMTKAEIDKAKQVMTSKMQISDDCKSEYAVEVQKTKEIQREHYGNVMPQIFNQLQDVEEKRITKIQTLITAAADMERQIMPIVSKCIDGMTTSATLIDCVEDSKLFISRYKTGFYPPNDVPFEDLSNTGASQGVSSSLKVDAGPRAVGTAASRHKKRQGLLGIFGAQKVEDVREDFGHLPPMQQKKQLVSKLESLKASLVKETSERDGMLKMQDIYKQNAKLGDPTTIEKQLEENAQKLDRLRQDIRKFENFLTEADGGSVPNGVQDGVTPTPSPLPVRHSPAEEPESISDRAIESSQDQRVIKQERPLITDQDSFDDEGLGTCVALYAFQATTDTALSMAEGEQFEVLERDEGDGWTHVRRSNGEIGFIPTSYVQLSYVD